MSQKMDIGTAALAVAATLVERSAELINDGWVQGQLYTKEGDAVTRFCILGALDLAFEEIFGAKQEAHKNAAMTIAQQMVVDEAYNSVGPKLGHGSIPGYNDASGRTQEEVVGVLQRAAERLWNLSVENEDVGYTWAPSKWAATEEGAVAAKQYLENVLA